jgi:nucleoid-associated protein YgaU
VEGVFGHYVVALPSTFRFYTVEAGDRWDTLAQRFYGDPQQWWRLADMNPELFDPRALRSGIVIRVP